MKNAISPGNTINYTNASGSTIPSGRIFKTGHILAVAVTDIAPGETGAAHITGSYSVPKVTGAVFAQGEKLLFDVSANAGVGAFDDSAATAASGDLMGAAVAFKAGADGETTAQILLTPGNATLTA